MRKKILVVIGSVILIIVLLEITIRLYDFANGLSTDTHNNLELLYVPSAYNNYDFKPNTKLTYNHRRHECLSINPLGLRGKAFSIKKDNVYRIICLGGSSTFGNGISDDDHTWPAQLEKILRLKYPDIRFEVINAGGFGYTSYELLTKYLFQLSNYNPDMVIFYETYNDASFIGRLSPEDNINSIRGRMHRNFIHKFLCHSAAYSFLSSRIFPSRFVPVKFRRIKPEFIDFGLNSFNKNIETLIYLTKRDNVKIVLCTQALWLDRIYKGRESTHVDKMDRDIFKNIINRCTQEIKRLAVKHNVTLIENSEIFKDDWDKYMINIVHPNDLGAEKLAQNISTHISINESK